MKYIDDAFIAQLRSKLDSTSSKDEVLSHDCDSTAVASAAIGVVKPHSDSSLSSLQDSEDLEFDYDHALKKIIRLVSVRERCTYELRQRLVTLGFSEAVVDDALSRAIDLGLVNDERYADLFIRCSLSNNKGKRGIEYELKKRGIDVFTLQGWPDEYFEEDIYSSEMSRALSVLERKPPTAKNKRDAAFRKLVSRGFELDVARQASMIYVEKCSKTYSDT